MRNTYLLPQMSFYIKILYMKLTYSKSMKYLRKKLLVIFVKTINVTNLYLMNKK